MKNYLSVFIAGLAAGGALYHSYIQYFAFREKPESRTLNLIVAKPIEVPGADQPPPETFDSVVASTDPLVSFWELKSRHKTSHNARRLGARLADKDPVAGLRALQASKDQLGDLYYIVRQELLAQWFLRAPSVFLTEANLIKSCVGGDSYESGWMERVLEQDFAYFKANVHHVPDGQDKKVALDKISAVLIAEDPESAVAWAEGLPKANQAFALKQLVSRGGVLTPERAAALAARLPSDVERTQLINAIADEWSRTNVKAALAWCESLTTQAEREVAFDPIFAAYSETHPEEAALYALRLVDTNTGNSYLRLAIKNLAAISIDKAWDYTRSLVAATDRDDYVGLMVEIWARQDPIEALDILSKDTVLASAYLPDLIRQVASDAPLSLVSRLSELPEGDLRTAVLDRSASELWRSDHTQALEWLESPEAAPLRDDAICAIVNAFSDEQPEEMVRLSATIQDPVKRSLSTTQAANAMARHKPDITATFIR